MRQAQSENEKKIPRWELTWSIFKTDFKRRMSELNFKKHLHMFVDKDISRAFIL